MPSDEAPRQYAFSEKSPIPPMPWEDPARGPVWRALATLASGFHPVRDVARVSHGELRPAFRFFLLSGLPAMLLAGIIPYTRRMQFGPELAVKLDGTPSPGALALDVASAAGLGLCIGGLAWLLSSWNFVGLARFTADPALAPVDPRHAAWRLAFYRGWLMPTAMLLLYAVAWAAPEPNQNSMVVLNMMFMVAPGVLQMMHFSAMTRYGGASALAAIPASFFPVMLYWIAVALAENQLMIAGYLVVPEAAAPK